MTAAEFVAACFLPLVIVFGLALKFVRKPDLLRRIVLAAMAVSVFYFILWLAYDQSSLVAVVDFYLFLAITGGGLIWFGLSASAPDPKSKWQAVGTILFGAALLVVSGVTLIPDFAQPRIVLEGRVQNLRIQPGSSYGESTTYLADIAGSTVKATTLVYERLKFLPVVRAEIGRGSHYIYKIEYLAN